MSSVENALKGIPTFLTGKHIEMVRDMNLKMEGSGFVLEGQDEKHRVENGILQVEVKAGWTCYVLKATVSFSEV